MHNAAKQIIAGAMIYFTTVAQVFGQAALLPNAEQQFFNNNGQPLASGSVQFYVPGTSTPKTTWTSSGQTTNNLNPVPLDIGGKAIIYGQGSYRQVVKDVNGNVIWDQPTTAYGSSQPSGATGTDTAPVGSVMAYSGFVVPTNWQLAAGQALSRTTFAALMTAITIQATNISCTNTSTTLTGFTDTSTIRVGAPIEATCLPTSTTVASITNATTIVVSNAAAATSTVTATIFPWGNGDQVSTFNVPDLRGRAPVGADCMNYVASGNTCAGNLTATYYGANPGAGGQTGGTQSKNLTIANLNSFTPTINSITPSGSVSTTLSSTLSQIASASGGGTSAFTTGPSAAAGNLAAIFNGTWTSTFTGNPVTPTMPSLGSGTAHSVVNPDATINYIIKVAPNSTGAGGVVSFGGMFGDIVCDSTLTCAPVASVNTVGCTPATTSQLGCVEPDGVTTNIVGGKLTAIAGVASSIGIGSTSITGGTNGEILSVSSGNLGQVATTGSGSVVLATSPTLVTPTLGAASATSINGNAFSGGPYTLTGSSGKTLTFNNTLTLAGIDATTLTFQGTDTYVGRSTTDTLTNKTLNCANNTCTVRLGSDVTGNLPLVNLATGSLDQVIGYFGATTGNAISINNCANALTYSTSTHTFGCNSSAGTGTVTSVGLTNTYGLSVSGSPVTSSGNISAGVSLTTAANTLSSDVGIANGSFTDGPSMAQGTSGTWDVKGSVTVLDTSSTTNHIFCKLWDGTTVKASGSAFSTAANAAWTIALGGIFSSPAANIRISCESQTGTATFKFNFTGSSNDSTISGIRIQ